MNDKNKNYSTQRIDDLTDQIHDDIREDIKSVKETVTNIHKILVGNGSEGLLRTVSNNKIKIKIVMWTLALLVAAIVGAYFGN